MGAVLKYIERFVEFNCIPVFFDDFNVIVQYLDGWPLVFYETLLYLIYLCFIKKYIWKGDLFTTSIWITLCSMTLQWITLFNPLCLLSLSFDVLIKNVIRQYWTWRYYVYGIKLLTDWYIYTVPVLSYVTLYWLLTVIVMV